MTSSAASEAFVWIWLPDAARPIVAGRLEVSGGHM
jgi:serine/threonine-protein kinase HipA